MFRNIEGRKEWTRRTQLLVVMASLFILMVTAFAASQALAGRLTDMPKAPNGGGKVSLPNGSGTAAFAPNIVAHVGAGARPDATVDASIFLTTSATAGNCPAPTNGGTTQVGCRFVLDMFVNAGSNAAPDGLTAQQSYMTFTYQTIQNARTVGIVTSCVPTNTVTGDLMVTDAALQNEVCDGPAPCNFRGTITDPGSFSYASGALSNCPNGCPDPGQPPPQDQPIFRIASIGVCAIAPGQAGFYWQFANNPPNDRCQNGAPLTRDSELVSLSGVLVQDCTRFANYTFTVTGVGFTPTNTNTPGAATNTPTVTIPVATNTNTAVATNTNTAVSTNTNTRTNTPISTNTNTAVATNTNTPVATNTNTSVATNTNTPVATNTNTRTNTPISTNTNTAVATNTNTAVATNTNTAVATNTNTRTNTPVSTNTNTSVATNTNTVVATNTNTSVPTNTNTSIPTNTNMPVATNTDTPTNTPTNTATVTNTPTNTFTPCPTCTNTPTNTPMNTVVANTVTSTSTPRNTPTNTHTPCPINFTDVQQGQFFYAAVRYLTCEGVITGYNDHTFRPDDSTTRAQLAKIVVLAVRLPLNTTGGSHFEDVAASNVFYPFIETAYNNNVVGGYKCGTVTGENCDTQNRPYFRPSIPVTRGQLTKIIVVAMKWSLNTTGGPHFTDVPNLALDPFYPYIETAFHRGVISGYTCGGAGETCDTKNRPYFRPGNDTTRGQIAKIVYLAINNP